MHVVSLPQLWPVITSCDMIFMLVVRMSHFTKWNSECFLSECNPLVSRSISYDLVFLGWDISDSILKNRLGVISKTGSDNLVSYEC